MLKNVPDVATPDALISAVGTKVFLNMEEVGMAGVFSTMAIDVEYVREYLNQEEVGTILTNNQILN
jgi:hypothetical protein